MDQGQKDYNISLHDLMEEMRQTRAEIAKLRAVNKGVSFDEVDRTLLDCENHFSRDLERVEKYSNYPPEQYNSLLCPGGIYSFHFGEHSVGSELRGTHPGMVLSNTVRYRSTRCIVVIPITSAKNGRQRILDKRTRHYSQWDAEALTNIPVRSNPSSPDMDFLALQQIRVVSPARVSIDARTGRPVFQRMVTDECFEEVERAIIRYFNLENAAQLQEKFENTMKAKRDADAKIQKMREHMKAAQNLVKAVQENPRLDAQHILKNTLKELEKALEL